MKRIKKLTCNDRPDIRLLDFCDMLARGLQNEVQMYMLLCN